MTEKKKEDIAVRKSNKSRRADDLRNIFLNHFSNQIQFGMQSVRVPLILNGAAAVALLAFLGNLWVKDEKSSQEVTYLVFSLYIFISGTALSGAAGLCTYLSTKEYTLKSRDNYLGFLQVNTEREDIYDPELPDSIYSSAEAIRSLNDDHLRKARKYGLIASSLTVFSFIFFLIAATISATAFA